MQNLNAQINALNAQAQQLQQQHTHVNTHAAYISANVSVEEGDVCYITLLNEVAQALNTVISKYEAQGIQLSTPVYVFDGDKNAIY